MTKANILELISEINCKQVELKQELFDNCDGLISIKGLEWIKNGLSERAFNPESINDLCLSYSLEDSKLNVICGEFTFSCKAYCFDGKSTFLMKDLREAEGSGVEMMQDIIIEKMLSDKRAKKAFGIVTDNQKIQEIVSQLSDLADAKAKALKELAKNHECITFTKKDLKEQIIQSSIEGEELRAGFDIEYLSYLYQIVIKNNGRFPFVCKARLVSEDAHQNSPTDDYSVIKTSYADIRQGKGGAEKKVFNALVDMATEPYWTEVKVAETRIDDLIK